MKKLILLLGTIFLAISIAACSPNNKADKSIHNDLLNYSNVELPKIVDLENDVRNSYESVSGENYTDDAIMLNALESHIIPQSSKLVEEAKDIVPETKEVQDVHNIYLSAIENQNSAFSTIVSAIKKQSPDEINLANEKLELARKKDQEFLTEIKKLAAENNIEFDNQ